MAITDYLTRLDSLRDQLADNLVEKGVDATQDESLTELIPKVLEITQGGGGSGANIGFATCREDRSFASKTKIISGITEIYLQSDTLLSPNLTASDFILSSNITGVTYINENLIKITFAALTCGDTLTLQAKASAYLYKNGISAEWRDTVRDLLEDYYFNTYGVTYVTRGVRTDSGSWSFTTPKGFPIPNSSVQIFSEFGVIPTVTNFSVDSDSFVTPSGRSAININQRDASSYNISWMICSTKDCGEVLKIRWEGYAHYNNANVDQIWELYIFANGDYSIIYEKKNSRYINGNNSIYGISYKQPAEGAAISFYATRAFSLRFDQISEFYNIKHHHNINLNPTADPIQTTLAAVTGTDAKDQIFIDSNSRQDDNSFTLKVPQMTWSKDGTNRNYITINGNTWFGIGSSKEDITLNRRDAALYSARVARFKFSDMNELECFKFVWKGSSRYSSAIDQEWELFLFANGDAMIHLTKLGSYQDGSYSFFGNNYKNKITPGGDCSFYRTNTEGTSWEIVQGTYDISRHHNV